VSFNSLINGNQCRDELVSKHLLPVSDDFPPEHRTRDAEVFLVCETPQFIDARV
jgi:hypothetical protein